MKKKYLTKSNTVWIWKKEKKKPQQNQQSRNRKELSLTVASIKQPQLAPYLVAKDNVFTLRSGARHADIQKILRNLSTKQLWALINELARGRIQDPQAKDWPILINAWKNYLDLNKNVVSFNCFVLMLMSSFWPL